MVPVVTLIDPGATHNFISEGLVISLGLHVQETEPYGVRMGTGDSEPSQGVCRGVLLQLDSIDVVEEFLPLRLGSSDVILGMKWLETLGTTHTNWKEQTMEFEVGGQRIKLTGDRSLGRSLISLRAMSKELSKNSGGLLIEMSNIVVEEKNVKEVPTFLAQVLEEFRDVFQEPTGLPPECELQHQIILKEGASPVSVRPYRYPHFSEG